MDFEDIIDELGSFGHWQRVIFFLICGADVFGAFAMLVPVFTGATPKWRCDTYEGLNVTILSQDLPNGTELMSCKLRDQYRCTNFTFYDDFTSIVSEWELICDKAYVSDLITTIQMVGLMLGAACFAQLSDTIGRKKAYFISFSIMILCGFVSAFSPMWQVFAACRFFVGIGFGAIMVVNCVYPLEFVGSQWRTLCGTIGFWAIGGMLLALCGFAVRQWEYLIILTSASGALYYITWFVIPESPRWLALQDRFDDAEQILLKIAEKNGRDPPNLTSLKDFVVRNRNEEKKLNNYTYLDLFRTWKYCRVALVMVVIWFTVFIMYYGLTYNLRNLSGNRYMNMFLAGFVDLIAMLSVILFNNRLGRRLTQLMFLVICIAADIIIIGVISAGKKESLADLVLVAALLGKACALAGTYVIQIWTAELFPTAIRNQGIGVGSVAARVGGMLAPQIVFSATYYELSPHIITGVLSVLCAPLLFLLAETRGKPLDDVFDPHVQTHSDKHPDDQELGTRA